MSIKISTRLVLLIGGYAIKIPLSYRGWVQGRNEAKVWEEHRDLCLLAPLLWSLGGIICMRRVSPVDAVPTHLITLVKALIPAMDIEACDLHRFANWGLYEGRIVLLDYGIDEAVSHMYR